MSAELLHFPGVTRVREPEPVKGEPLPPYQDTIKFFEEYLEQAKQGRIEAAAIIVVRPNDDVSWSWRYGDLRRYGLKHVQLHAGVGYLWNKLTRNPNDV